jgi:alanine-synthesizing transaminase
LNPGRRVGATLLSQEVDAAIGPAFPGDSPRLDVAAQFSGDRDRMSGAARLTAAAVRTRMFSSRIPSDLSPNRLALAVERRRARGDAVLDLTDSNPTRAGLRYERAWLDALAGESALLHEPAPFGLAAARAAVAADYQRRGLDVPAARVILTTSTSESFSILFKLLCDPGDEVLVPRPSYPLFEYLTRLEGARAVPYQLEREGRWAVDLASVERALTPRTRAILVVHPNNPTGSLLDRAELDALAGLCRDRGLALVGDEVFADYRLEPFPGAAGSVLDQREALTFCLGGLSKSIGLPQLKLGWIAAQGPEALVQQAMRRLELVCDTYLSVSAPIQHALGALFAGGAAVRAQIAARTGDNYRALASHVAKHPSCRLLRAEGGWSAVIQVPATRSEEELVLALLEQDGVLVHPGYFFDFPRAAFVVVSLLPPREVFDEAITRLLVAAEV